MSLIKKPKDEKPNVVAKLEKDEKPDKKPLVAKNRLEVPGEDDIKNSFDSGITITWENGVKIRTNKKTGRRYRWDRLRVLINNFWSGEIACVFFGRFFPKILSLMLIFMFLYHFHIEYDEKILSQAYNYFLFDLASNLPFQCPHMRFGICLYFSEKKSKHA